jgi:DNA-binding MarR family transcriptional regulator
VYERGAERQKGQGGEHGPAPGARWRVPRRGLSEGGGSGVDCRSNSAALEWSGPCILAGRVKGGDSRKAAQLSSDLEDFSAGAEAMQRWFTARRWRRDVERALAPLKLTLPQWLALDAMERLICELKDAVSQAQVGRYLEIDKATLCQVMQRLERRGFVDQAPEFGGSAYRIYLTAAGRRAVQHGRLQVEAVSAAWQAASSQGDVTSQRQW